MHQRFNYILYSNKFKNTIKNGQQVFHFMIQMRNFKYILHFVLTLDMVVEKNDLENVFTILSNLLDLIHHCDDTKLFLLHYAEARYIIQW